MRHHDQSRRHPENPPAEEPRDYELRPDHFKGEESPLLSGVLGLACLIGGLATLVWVLW